MSTELPARLGPDRGHRGGGARGGIWYLHHINSLHLTLFRPYRGDPWPQGVQEDDDVHWQWSRRRHPLPSADADDDDTPSGPIDLTRLRVSIRRGRR
jgi:hypothetical protein